MAFIVAFPKIVIPIEGSSGHPWLVKVPNDSILRLSQQGIALPDRTNTMTIATWITVSRLLGIPLILYCLHAPDRTQRTIAVAIFLVAALTDWLDGYVARRFNQISDLGKFLDPLVDKLLIIAPLLALIELQEIPAWGVFLIIGREIGIAGWRVSQPQISGANIWGKLKTVSQIIAIALLIAPLEQNGETIALISFWIAVVLTIVSGIIYLIPDRGTPVKKDALPFF